VVQKRLALWWMSVLCSLMLACSSPTTPASGREVNSAVSLETEAVVETADVEVEPLRTLGVHLARSSGELVFVGAGEISDGVTVEVTVIRLLDTDPFSLPVSMSTACSVKVAGDDVEYVSAAPSGATEVTVMLRSEAQQMVEASGQMSWSTSDVDLRNCRHDGVRPATVGFVRLEAAEPLSPGRWQIRQLSAEFESTRSMSATLAAEVWVGAGAPPFDAGFTREELQPVPDPTSAENGNNNAAAVTRPDESTDHGGDNAVVTAAVLPRSGTDRPGAGVFDLKPVYVTLKNGPDNQRDTDGTMNVFLESMLSWFSEEFPGRELRVDRFNGALDIQHIELPVTTEEYLELFSKDPRGGDAVLRAYREAGLDVPVRQPGDAVFPYGTNERIYVGFVEGPRGLYVGTEPEGCLHTNYPALSLWHVREVAGEACDEALNPVSWDPAPSGNWNMVAQLVGALGDLPGCAVERGAYFGTPNAERVAELGPLNDLMRVESRSSGLRPRLDPDRRWYFKIEEGAHVGDRCRDIQYSPFWAPVRVPVLAQPAGTSVSVERTSIDLEDDSLLHQIKVFYVVPSDGIDERLDIDGRLASMVQSANSWLRDQTGKRLRFDTYRGQLDVTFVRLDETEAELWRPPEQDTAPCRERPCPVPDDIAGRLEGLGVLPEHKLPFIFYGGQVHPGFGAIGCGGAGRRSAWVIWGLVDPAWGDRACDVPFVVQPAGGEGFSHALGLVHEIFHTLGAVDPLAPNSSGEYHIIGDPDDLMSVEGGSGPWHIDKGRDDYWGHGLPGVIDVARSVFTEPAGTDLPPWLRSR
jgi:hypothetical protein